MFRTQNPKLLPTLSFIENLPKTASKNTEDKVIGLLTDALKLKDVNGVSTERKRSFSNNTPGDVVAKMLSFLTNHRS